MTATERSKKIQTAEKNNLPAQKIQKGMNYNNLHSTI